MADAPDIEFGTVTRAAMPWLGQPVRTNDYDAATDNTKRKASTSTLRSEDRELTELKRKKLVGGARDLRRNFSIAAWMIRKHLDFVASFNFQCNTGDKAVDNRVLELMRWYDRAENCDVANRHSLRKKVRLYEAHRVVDGDVGILKISGASDRGKLQDIEGDRIRSGPPSTLADGQKLEHGVITNEAGKALAYQIHKRAIGAGFEYERTVPASRMIMHGFYDRLDQVRGISPIVAALNSLRDVYEGFDYALAKAKVSQLFGLKIFRDAVETFDNVTDNTDSGGGYDVDFGRGPVILDLNPGDNADFIESKNPSTEFQAFTQAIIMVSLKALDLPYSFYDESFTNFFGSRAALIQYQKSCNDKRADVLDLLRKVTTWRLGMFVDDGVLQLPRMMALEDIAFKWTPSGMPWWDPAKEVKGATDAIAAGLRTRSEVRQEMYGDSWEDVIDRLAEEEKYMEAAGVHVTLETAGEAEPAIKGEDDDEIE